MHAFKFWRTVPGVVLSLSVLAAGSAGAYALTNWFNGRVAVHQEASIFAVDLSECQGGLPAGVEGSDRHRIQFKILGSPHISADQLRSDLLADCELQAVRNFYHQHASSYSLLSGKVVAADNAGMTLAYTWGGQSRQQRLSWATGAVVYSQSQLSLPADLQPGDAVVVATASHGAYLEGIDPLSGVTQLQSAFKTRYDVTRAPTASKQDYYAQQRIMPLDWYRQTHR